MNERDLLRKLNIDLITGDHNPIIKTFEDIWSHLYVIEIDVYHKNGGELIFYIINDDKRKFIFYRDGGNASFWSSYINYWQIFEYRFNLRSSEIQTITMFLIEQALINIKTLPNYPSELSSIPVEQVSNKIKDKSSSLREYIEAALEKITVVPHPLNNIYYGDLYNVLGNIKYFFNDSYDNR